MLIEKGPDVGDVVTIKLNNGDEVVGKMSNRAIDSVTLAKPIKIVIERVSQNQVGLAFAPYLASVQDASVVFSFSGMVSRPVKTGEDVKRNYLQATTDLVMPTPEQTAGILLP